MYYFSNTTAKDYEGDVLLRGELNPEFWNPHNGKIRRAESTLVNYRGEIYTKITMKLQSAESVFIVSGKGERELLDLFRDMTEPKGQGFVPNFVPDTKKQ